jgi:lipid-A-disaccharide synthase
LADTSHPRIFLSAGEASGDHYGAAIVSELRKRLPQASFTGLGGAAMEAAGQHRVVRAEDVAHMGLTEVIRHAPYIYSQYWKLVGSIKRERPDVAVLIDFPDVNFRLAKHLRRLGVPVVWFVSPQLWAWKRGRLRWVQQRVDRMLVIFPFEEAFYRARGVDVEFVGHPLAGMALPSTSRQDYAARNGLNEGKLWIALLPGSREKEVAANLPTMLDAAAELGLEYEYIIPVASTLTKDWIQKLIASEEQLRDRTGNGNFPSILHMVDDARAALFHARAAVVASGTATVQALTVGNPFVVVYRVSKLTFAVAKAMIRYPAEIPAKLDADGNLPVGMVNLIAGRRIVPELLNERFTAANLAAALRPLLEDTAERRQMIADLAAARAKLLPDTASDPIGRVCDAVEGLLAGRATDVRRTAASSV